MFLGLFWINLLKIENEVLSFFITAGLAIISFFEGYYSYALSQVVSTTFYASAGLWLLAAIVYFIFLIGDYK